MDLVSRILRAFRPGKPDFDASAHPRKLNLGSGTDARDGYVNVDMNAWTTPDLLADIRELDFLPASFYDEILAQDVLEHLPRADTQHALLHWNRLLRMGGTLIVRVPSVIDLADLFKHPDYQQPHSQEGLIRCLFGTQAYAGDWHFTAFTRVLLEHYLEKAGFKPLDVRLLHGWLFEATAEKVTHIETAPARDFKELMAIASDQDFVVACYREILKREADPGGYEFFLNGLREGGLARTEMIRTMLSSPEYRPDFRAIRT